jgi:WD40 repeat protein
MRTPTPADLAILGLGGLATLLYQDQQRRWALGERPSVEEYLERCPQLRANRDLVAAFVLQELLLRKQAGEEPSPEELEGRFPEIAPLLRGAGRLEALLANVPPAPLGAPVSAAEMVTLVPLVEPLQNGPADPAEAHQPREASVAEEAPQVTVPGYEVLGVLQKGSMAVVYLAEQIALRRVVALEVVLPGTHAGPEERRRFLAEAEVVGQLAHPNIVQVYEVGEHNGMPYLALEHCTGGSVAQQLDGTPWRPTKAAELVQVLAEAMHAAHQSGIVHGGLEPANVLLTAAGTPKITGFGLARRLDVKGQPQAAALSGSPCYLAPEQADGKGRTLGPAADIHALGVILYELLIGRPPFRGATTTDTLHQVVSAEPVPVRRLQPMVARDLETICLKCLEKAPRKRYKTAEALAADLRRFVASEPASVRPVGPFGRCLRWARRRPVIAALLVLLVVTAGAGVTWAVWDQYLARDEADLARQEKEQADEITAAAQVREKAAQRQTYIAEVGRVSAQLDSHDFVAAILGLERIGLEHRGWEHAYLSGRAEGTPLTLRGESSPVMAVAYSPDGLRLAAAHQNVALRVWDVRTGHEAFTVRMPTSGGITSLDYTPDGGRIVTAWSDMTVRVWDARNGAGGNTIGRPPGHIRCVRSSPDGALLAVASQDGTVRLWDSKSGAEVGLLRGHAREVIGVAFSPDGSRIASASADASVKVWDVRGRRVVNTFPGHAGMVSSVSYSPDGSRIASASADHTIKVWDVQKKVELATLRGHTGPVSSACFSPDGARIVSASEDATVKLWDVNSGVELATFHGHTGPVSSVCFSPDGARIASAAGDSTVKVWDAVSAAVTPVLRSPGGANAAAYSPDGQRIAGAGQDGTVRIWDHKSGGEVAVLRGHTNAVVAVAYSPDGARIASGSQDGKVKVWDARTGVERLTLDRHTNSVTALCFSPDGARIVSAAEDAAVKVWDARSGVELATLPGTRFPQFAVACSPNGSLIAAGSFAEVKLWDAHTFKELTPLRGINDRVIALCFSPDGPYLAGGLGDRSVKVWDVGRGKELATLLGHTGPVQSVCYSPDGSRIASAAGDRTARAWDVPSYSELITLRGHSNRVQSVCFSPSGTFLATASADGTVRVWDSRKTNETITLRGHEFAVTHIAFSPDSTRIMTMDPSGRGFQWEIATGKRLENKGGIEGMVPGTVSPDRKYVAVLDGKLVHVRRVSLAPGSYSPWAEDIQRQRVQLPVWHAEQAEAASRRGDRLAADFHARCLARDDNLRLLAWARLAGGDRAGCLEALRRLEREVHAGSPRDQLFAAMASGLMVRPVPGSAAMAVVIAASPLGPGAAGLVRAAALLPDSGTSGPRLVELARNHIEGPRSAQYHELLGAALFRAGQWADAARELNEAVRLHAEGRSLWSKLFLALAHQRLGNTAVAQQWRDSAQQASTWEEAVVQRQLLLELDTPRPPDKR